MNRLLVGLALVLASGCTPELPDAGSPGSPPPLIAATIEDGYPQLDAACRAPVAEPTHLVVTSTDFGTGAVGLVELATHTVLPDLALASTDAVPVAIGERVFVINRHGYDYVDELDGAAQLELVHEWPIMAATSEASANPHDLALDSEDRAWLSLHGAAELQAFTFPQLQGAAVAAQLALDLAAFADADGIPELSLVIACGDTMFVSAERIDRSSWVPVSTTVLIPVGVGEAPQLFEFDAEHPGADAITLAGVGVGPWRLDPSDAAGHTIVLLDSGLERVDLAAGTRSWLVEEQTFVDAGYERLQLSGFDFDDQGRAWVAAATADFAGHQLLRVELDGDAAQLVVELDGLRSVTGELEIAGSLAYFPDTSVGASGLRVFDLSSSPVVELAESPLAVGLPPMSLAPMQLGP